MVVGWIKSESLGAELNYCLAETRNALPSPKGKGKRKSVAWSPSVRFVTQL